MRRHAEVMPANAGSGFPSVPGFLIVTSLALLATGCSSSEEPSPELPATPFLVSGPLPPPAPTGAATRLVDPSTVAYVSLLPGSLLDAASATITNAHSGASQLVSIVEGGFDPVALAASLGDTLVISVRDGAGHAVNHLVLVKAKPPVVVRTVPRRNKRDVPLNVRVTVVFSQPIDPLTLNAGTVRLTRGGAAVSGQLGTADSAGTVIEFVPAEALAAATEYRLAVSTDIHDVEGRALASSVEVPFSTAGADAPLGERWPWYVSRAVPYQYGTWAFISAPPGALPSQASVSINRQAAVPVIGNAAWAGALDPASVAASAGDTLRITIMEASGTPMKEYYTVVPEVSVPVVLRSEPSANETAFRTDLDLLVVFSEPLDIDEQRYFRASAMRLETAGATVPGRWSPGGRILLAEGSFITFWAPFRVAFTPDSELTLATNYELVLTSSLTGDGGGSPMALQRIPFATVNPPPGPLDAVLSVQSFSVIEYQNPGDPRYYYAPRLRLTETGGTSEATVVKLGVALPDWSGMDYLCMPSVPVAAGQSADMFSILYGDYEVSYFWLDETYRAGEGRATISVIYRDDAGRTDTLTADGPVTPGSGPDVQTAGVAHGYFGGTPGCQKPWAALRSGEGATPVSAGLVGAMRNSATGAK